MSPSRKPAGSELGSVWLSSTCSVPPSSPTATGASSRPSLIRSSSSIRSAVRAKYPARGGGASLELGDHHDGQHHLVLGEPQHGARVRQQHRGVEDKGPVCRCVQPAGPVCAAALAEAEELLGRRFVLDVEAISPLAQRAVCAVRLLANEVRDGPSHRGGTGAGPPLGAALAPCDGPPNAVRGAPRHCRRCTAARRENVEDRGVSRGVHANFSRSADEASPTTRCGPRARLRRTTRAGGGAGPADVVGLGPEAAVPLGVGPKGPQEVDVPEVGPVGLAEVELAVRTLPQQEPDRRCSPEVRMTRSGSG